MGSFYMRTFGWGLDRVRMRDMFQHSISLTFKGKRTFSTLFGGFASLIVLTFIIIFGIILTIKMFERTNVQWDQNLVRIDFDINKDVLNITAEDNLILQVTFVNGFSEPMNGSFDEYARISIYSVDQQDKLNGIDVVNLDFSETTFKQYD